ncbi:hypothetical protein AB0C10_11345 [Microbispora amethystogenes]|uniref:hypothetical protein n=1 Tax=Microbispora amethystogenes TaxID=1427754 RepID=UPI0033EA823C
MRRDIDHLLAGTAPAPGPGMTRGARELFEEITAHAAEEPTAAGAEPGPGSPRRWRRWGLSVVAALVAALGLAGPGILGLGAGPAAAALDVRQDGGYYVVMVRDLYADPEVYQEQLRGLGLDVSLRLVPASPSLVGRIWEGAVRGGEQTAEGGRRKDAIETIDGCVTADFPCAIGLRIPVGYSKKIDITLGRRGRDGEQYTMLASIDAPGEPLHCTGFRGARVDRVVALLRSRGVPHAVFVTADGDRATVPGSWFVHEGVLRSAGTARLLVGPTHRRPDVPGPRMWGDDCRKGSS